MSIDSFVISALVDEFTRILVGGRVQDVIDVDDMGLGLEIYADRKRHYLYMSADPNHPRAHLADGKLRRGLMKPTQLGLMFRRTVEHGVVAHVSQPDWERLLRIDIDGPQGDVTIVVEAMPRRANVLLLKDGVILDCLNRVGPDDNRYRLSLPNHQYVPPPPLRDQLDPRVASAVDLRRMLASVDKGATQTRRLLPGRILGLSPILAREVVFRATGNANAKARETDSGQLFEALQCVMSPLLARDWQPGVGREDEVAACFSATPLTFLPWDAADSMSAAITRVYGSIRGADAYEEAKRQVRQALANAKARLAGKMASLESGLKDDREMERLRQSGELILAYQYTLRDGQECLKAEYEPAAPPLEISLNPKLSPLENAQAYFRKYEKAKSAMRATPDLIAETRVELDFLAQLETDLASAVNWLEIDEVIQHLQARGHWRGKTSRRIGGGGSGPLRVVSRDGFVIWIGRNSRQNDKVTFKTANRQDIWLHARGAPGAHVIIRNDGRRISADLIAEAAAVAAHYSQRQTDGQVAVDYTRVKYVRAIKGAGPGMVTYRNEQTLTVKPRDESILH